MTILQIPTPNLKQTIKYYDDLGFKYESLNDQHYIFDNQITIEIDTSHVSRIGIKIFSIDFSKMISALEKIAPITKTDNGLITTSPSGCWVYLAQSEAPKLNTSKEQNTILGNFSGISIESHSFKKEVKFWKLLGFKITAGSANDPWASLVNEDKFVISLMKPLMCPHLFFNPSLTFFNGKNNPQIIDEIRTRKIPIRQEITHFNKNNIVDNIILCDPSGLGAFIFND